MARRVGIEPTLADLESAVLPLNERRMVEKEGVEPSTEACKADALPTELNPL
jgi:hypothetical protein